MTRLTKYYPFEGGLDLVTPPLALEPGYLLGSLNYEIETGTDKGYRRIDGYERFDGQMSPSDAVYWVIDFDAGTVEPAVDAIIVGTTSLARGVVITVELDSGAWDGTGVGSIIFCSRGGTFQNNDVLVAGSSAFTIGFEHEVGVAAGFE